MAIVRDRSTATASTRARNRRQEYRRFRAGAYESGTRFDAAFDWLREAARYAERRAYPDRTARSRATARLDQIRDDAARVIQAAADQIAKPIPALFRPSANRAVIRSASAHAGTAKERMDLARAWQMHAYSLVRRYAVRDAGAALAQAERVRDEAAMRLVEWAEELDADDYCQ